MNWTPGRWAERGERERVLGPRHCPRSSQVRSLSPLVTGRAAALTTSKQRCVFCFLVSLPGAAGPGMTTRGRAVPTVLNGAAGAGKGTPRGHSGHPAASDTAAPFMIGLQVQCELLRGGRGSEALSLFGFCTPSPHPRSRSLMVPARPERSLEGQRDKSTRANPCGRAEQCCGDRKQVQREGGTEVGLTASRVTFML